ncbi:MAG: hypothetical protein IAG13_11800 [Deltaproteobacteria bacterium]|nr:hypothetical protein [Nannocystaceae bacterium]
MAQRQKGSPRSQLPRAPDEDEFWLVLDTITDAQRELEEHARRTRVHLCHELGEMLTLRLAQHGWTRETLARLSTFLADKGVAPELAAIASLVRAIRMMEHERELSDGRGLAPIFEPPAPPRRSLSLAEPPAAWAFALDPFGDALASPTGNASRPANP